MAKVVYFNIDDNLDYENGLLKEWGVTDVELAEIKDKTSGKFTEYLQDADGLVVEYEQVTKSVMEQCPKLKIVAVQSIGTNNLEKPGATELGICLTNAPGFCAEEVALHTVGMINVLFFSYISASLPLEILKIRSGYTLTSILRYDLVFDFARFLLGAIGIVLAIPVSGGIALLLCRKERG